MNNSENIKTDVVLNMKNLPFLTLTESKINNIWYHDKLDCIFSLCANGFRVIKGSKQNLLKNTQ